MERRRRLEDGSSNPWDNLSIELFDYLLSRLSVKVLLRCRIVCKQWMGIIDRIYPWMKDFNPGNTCIFGCSADVEITGPIIYGIIKKGDEMIPERIATFPELRGFRHGLSGKVNSSHGLILLERHDDKSFRILESAVINPLTKEMVVVPGSPYQPVAFDNLTLGCDSSSSSPKLVQLLVRDENNNLGAAIYNLRRGERRWVFIPFPGWLLEFSFENQDQERRGGICVEGSLFWTLNGPGGRRRRPIVVSFHLSSEKFKLRPMPKRHYKRYELAKVGRCLTLWDLSFGDRIEIWSLVKGWNKKKMWIRSWFMFLDGPIYTMNNVTGVYHYGDCLLIQGSSSTGESLFVIHDKMDRFFKCTLKDRSLGLLNVYSHSWNSKPLLLI